MHRAIGEQHVGPTGVKGVDLVVARAVDQADAVAADAVCRGAVKVSVGEGIGPGAAAAADRVDRAVNRAAVLVVDRAGVVVADGPSGPSAIMIVFDVPSVMLAIRTRAIGVFTMPVVGFEVEMSQIVPV